MTLDDLTVGFRQFDATTLLADWTWLIGERRRPILVTVAGDAFVQDQDDGSVHFLDTVEGRLTPVAMSLDGFRQLLGDQQFVLRFFSYALVAPLLRAGTRPDAGEVFSFDVPPVLGGEQSTARLEPIDMAVHFSLLGQLFQQVQGLPPGTPIDGVRLRR